MWPQFDAFVEMALGESLDGSAFLDSPNYFDRHKGQWCGELLATLGVCSEQPRILIK